VKTVTFTAVVYPARSVEAAVSAFAVVCRCRIASTSPEAVVVEFSSECSLTAIRELANYALDHAVMELV
jgi:hypothetical protein